jgi:hypothetical protein
VRLFIEEADRPELEGLTIDAVVELAVDSVPQPGTEGFADSERSVVVRLSSPLRLGLAETHRLRLRRDPRFSWSYLLWLRGDLLVVISPIPDQLGPRAMPGPPVASGILKRRSEAKPSRGG